MLFHHGVGLVVVGRSDDQIEKGSEDQSSKEWVVVAAVAGVAPPLPEGG